MADMKTVVQGIDSATGKIKSVYKKLVDLGDGTYAEATTSYNSLEAVTIKGTATGGSSTLLVDDTMDLEPDLVNGSLIKMTIGGTDYIRKITGSAGPTVGFLAILDPVAATVVMGTGLEAEGQITIACKGDLLGEIGNSYAAEIVQGTETTGDNIATLNDVLKVLTITVNLNGLGEPRTLAAGDVENVLSNTVGVADKFEVVSFLPGNLTISGVSTPFILGADGVSVEVGTPYEIYQNPRTIATEIIGKVVPSDADGDEKFTVSNPGVITLSGSSVTDITFHNEAVAAADGAILTVGTNKTLTIEIYGTSTSRTIAFIGRSASGEDRALSGVKLNGLSVATGTTGSGELWQFDITGLTSVFIDLQAVAGGNVSIKGKAVA